MNLRAAMLKRLRPRPSQPRGISDGTKAVKELATCQRGGTMDIQITSTGKIFYQVDPTLAAILMEMFPAAIERHKAPAPEPLRWEYACTKLVTGLFVLSQKKGHATEYYDAPLDGLDKVWPDCPQSVREEYAKVRVSERATNRRW